MSESSVITEDRSRSEPRARDDRLRILHVVEAFAGGLFEIVRILAQYQRAAGHEVAIAFARIPGTPRDLRAAVGPGIELVELPWDRRHLGSTIRATASLRREAQRLRPDVAHLHSSFAGFIGSIVLPRVAVTVYTPHGYSLLRPSRGRLTERAELVGERWIARRVDAVGTVSQQEAELARTAVRANRVATIRNGLPELDSPSVRERTVGERDRPLVVAMGLIKAARMPEQTGPVLTGVADLADIEWIGGRLAKDASTPMPDLPTTGWLERDQALARLGSATAYVHWSAWDGSPLTVLEAFARDVVVVASDVPANRELLGREQLCKDTKEAVELLRRILTDPPTRERLLKDQRARRSRFSAERMAADWNALYADLVGSRESGSRGR